MAAKLRNVSTISITSIFNITLQSPFDRFKIFADDFDFVAPPTVVFLQLPYRGVRTRQLALCTYPLCKRDIDASKKQSTDEKQVAAKCIASGV